ncbi:MAG: RNA methyltransferase [Candidatus Cloacimonadaceae bacterium]
MRSESELRILPLSKSHLSELKKLKQKKFRRLENQTLVEGRNLIEQLIANNFMPEEIITSSFEAASEFLGKTKCDIYTAKPHEINELTDTETPQPFAALFEIPQFSLDKYKVILYLDGIRDPGNLGAIFRTAAAFSLDGIVLSPDCCEVFAPKVVRASLGSVFFLPSEVRELAWLKTQSAQKIGLVMDGDIRLQELTLSKAEPVIVIIGSEGSGISAEVMTAVTQKVGIPIAEKMESLNAAVSAGIAVYEITNKLCH